MMEHRDFPETLDNQSWDDINDLFDYDVGVDELLQELPQSPSANAPEASGLKLGLDEEVKVTKKRQPVAKLDDNRLLSPAGIPKLRRISKQKLKFKGKGHEFSDAARLLSFYQLWLDDLFPRAKFVDGLAIIEKLGHSKRLQSMRRAWIEEEKPQAQADAGQNGPISSMPELCKSMHLNSGGDDNQQSKPNHLTPHETRRTESHTHTQTPLARSDIDQLFVSSNGNASHPPGQDIPDEDELEALLNGHDN